MGIRMTPAAIGAALAALRARGRGIGVRLCVSLSGCSGMSYWLEFADELADSEVTFSMEGLRLIVQTSHLVYCEGLEIDYVRKENEEGFVVNGPNTCQDACECPDTDEASPS